MIDAGSRLLKEYGGVILDGTFRRAADREMAGELAARSGAHFRLIECKLAPGMLRPRLERRAAGKETLSDATWATYLRQREEMEPSENLPVTQLLLDNSHAISISCHIATDWLRHSDDLPR